LSPISTEGWVVTLVAVAAAIAVGTFTRGERWAALPVVILLLVIVFLKGTSPGGPRQWAEFQARQRRGDG
jgi:hypothetical protein